MLAIHHDRQGRGKMGELVSIITPMYNAEKTIAQTVESVLAQTYTDWEMIIIDDCSTDHSAEIVLGYRKKDQRIHYYKKKKNSGAAQARNSAIRKAKGDYLAFLDSDDIWKPRKLERQINFMKATGTEFCYTACGIIDKNGKMAGKDRLVPEKVTYASLLKGNSVPCLTAVVERKCFKGIRIPDVPHEDYATWLAVLRNGVKARGINEVLADYRVYPESLSAKKWEAAQWTWNIFRKQEKLSFIKSSYYFCCYAIRAIRKRI